MTLKHLTALVALALTALAPAHAAAPTPQETKDKLDKLAGTATARVIYSGATLIDGTAAAPRAGMSIVVNGDRIESIVPTAQLGAAAKANARVVDVSGQYVLPGLIDSHVHYVTNPDVPYAESVLRHDIYGGVTSVRDMAGDARVLAGLARAALVNQIPSPDIFYAALVAGPSFFQDPRVLLASLGVVPGKAPWMYAVDDNTNIALTVAQARGTGATGLKIYANLSGPLVQKLIAEAKRQNFPVWTHAQVYPATPYDSLGATTVSHVCMIARHVLEPGKSSYGHSEEPSYEGMTAANPGIQKYIAALAASGTIMDATLSIHQTDGPHCHIGLAGDITRAMQAAGVKIIAGTDTDGPGDDAYPTLDLELENLVKYAGFTPRQAITAATATAAEALGKQREIGTLEAGKYANMVFLRRDPVQDISNIRSVVLTVKRGHEFARADYKFVPFPPHED